MTTGEPMPAWGRALRAFIVLLQVAVALATLLALVTGGVHRAFVVGLAAVCVYLAAHFLLHLGAGVYGARETDRLWRERMASGFYKTLPPTEEDDD
jgi:hypothetical protein